MTNRTKTELIESAINRCVDLCDDNDKWHQGWLVRSEYARDTYVLLPFAQVWEGKSYHINAIKHLAHLSNGHHLW